MARDRTFDLLLEALGKPGCALCRVVRDAVQRYLDGFMYEDVTDVELRRKMREAQGFCRPHADQAILVRDSLGLAIIYQDILTSVEREMRAAAASPRLPGRGLLRRNKSGPGQGVIAAMAARRACPACAVSAEMLKPAVQTLVDNLLTAELGAAFASCAGLCLPHLRQALAVAESPALVDALVTRQRQVIESLTAELGEFIRKHDYRFRREAMGSEIDSWDRAIKLVIGGVHEKPNA